MLVVDRSNKYWAVWDASQKGWSKHNPISELFLTKEEAMAKKKQIEKLQENDKKGIDKI